MKHRYLIAPAFALLALPAFAQSPADAWKSQPKPDVVTLSRSVVEANAKACSELVAAFESGAVLIKELRAENDELRKLSQLQTRQIETLRLANAKLEEANAKLDEALAITKQALVIANEQHAKDAAALVAKDKTSRKKKIIVATLKIGAIGGATVACGFGCGVAAAAGMEVLPVVLKGK